MFAREVAEPDGRDKPFLVFLQGGPGFEAPRPTGIAARPRLARPGAEGLPRADARPARHRALDAGRRGRDRRVPDALPRRLDRARRRAAAHSARRRSRWSVLGQSFGGLCVVHLPLARARGPARGVHHRRRAGHRHADRRRLPRDLRADDRAQPPLLRALPGGPRADAGARRAARRRGRAAPERRPADVAPAAHARQQARHERRPGVAALRARAAAGLARVPARRAGPARLARNPIYAAAARGVLGRRRRHELVSAQRHAPGR